MTKHFWSDGIKERLESKCVSADSSIVNLLLMMVCIRTTFPALASTRLDDLAFQARSIVFVFEICICRGLFLMIREGQSHDMIIQMFLWTHDGSGVGEVAFNRTCHKV